MLAYIYTKANKNVEALKLVDEYLLLVQKSQPEYKELINRKATILRQTRGEGFRQQPVNLAKKKHKKKRK